VNTIALDEQTQRFSTKVDGYEAELLYELGSGVMRIMATHVPKSVEGRGIAGELTRAAIGKAKQEGWTIEPVCSYAVTYFKRHPDDTLVRQRQTDGSP
jgi:predicted GNAT family acetyltransferase